MKYKYNKIMFAGPSGYGKTTMAKEVTTLTDRYKFISGSVSDLLPQTKEISHKDMLARSSETLYKEDFQILNLRNKLFGSQDTPFVTDRSYLDSAAYFLYKQADNGIPSCEIEHFIDLSKMLLNKQCDCLIFLNFIPELISEWVIEDNKKRITNNYFQLEISSIMRVVLNLMGYRYIRELNSITGPSSSWLGSKLGLETRIPLNYGVEIGEIESLYGHTDVFIINEANKYIRDLILIDITTKVKH